MKRLWLQFTNRFGRSVLHPQFIVKILEYEAVKQAKKYAKGKLLDIGCGTMPYRKELLQVVNEYTGLDYPETKKLYPGAPSPDVLGDAKHLPFANKVFDTVLMLQVLEHIDDPELAIKEAHRVLKDRGVLIISVPFMYPVHDIPYDYFRFTQYAIKNLLSYKFKIIHLSRDGTFLEFWLQSLIIFFLTRSKQFIEKKNILLTIFGIILLITILPIAIITNLLIILLKPTNSWFTNLPNTFPLNYTIVAKKKGKI